MKINVVKNGFNQLIAATSKDFEKLQKLSSNQIYEFDFKKVRNYEFHKKFFALVNQGFENSKYNFPNYESYRNYIIQRAGHFVAVITEKGMFTSAKSISFDNMDETEFERVYKDVLQAVIIDTGATEEEINNNYSNFM